MKNIIHSIAEKISASKILYPILGIALFMLPASANAKPLPSTDIIVQKASPQPVKPQLLKAKALKAPEAVFENGAGEKIKISDLKGKVVFINFWATWCPPCRAEMPTINKLYAQFKDNKDIVFLIVDADNKYAKSKAYLTKNKFDLPLYVPSGNIPYDYFSGALPTTVMINKEGEIVFHHAGSADYSDPKMIAFIKKLVAGEA